MSFRQAQREYREIQREVGVTWIRLLRPEWFIRVPGGFDIRGDAGGAAHLNRQVISWNITVAEWLEDLPLVNTLWHEAVGHLLYPWRPEWWCLLLGERMAGGGGFGRTEYLRGHTIDEMPPRARLLELARRQVERMRG